MRLIRYLDHHLEEIFLMIFLCIITLNTGLQCIMRYAFNNSLSWTDELSKYCFVYSGFFSIGYCIKQNNNLKVDILMQLLPAKAGIILGLFTSLLTLAFFGYMFKPTFEVLRYYWGTGTRSAALQLPMYFVYGIPFVGFSIGIMRSIQFIYKHLVRKPAGSGAI